MLTAYEFKEGDRESMEIERGLRRLQVMLHEEKRYFIDAEKNTMYLPTQPAVINMLSILKAPYEEGDDGIFITRDVYENIVKIAATFPD